MTEPDPPGTGDEASPGSARLRRRLSWVIAGALALAALVAHGVEASLAYTLGPEPLHHGNYGFDLARIPARDGRPRVVLLGNSVYQSSGVVERMQARAGQSEAPLELVNLAQLGSGITDHVVHAVKATAARPDLLVVSIGDLTFTDCLPVFRTTVDQVCFDPGYAARLPGTFLRRHFGVGGTLQGLATTAVPFARSDPILRHAWAQSRLGRPRWLYELLRFPTLNLAGDLWDAEGRGVDLAYPSHPPYAFGLEAVDELLAVTGDTPLLVIWQESAPVPWVPALLAQVQARVERRGGRFADLRAHYDPRRFVDIVHPGEGELDAYADRHLRAIRVALARD